MDNKLILKKKIHWDSIFIRVITIFTALITVGLLFGIISYIMVKGLPLINWEFLTTGFSYSEQKFNILPMIINTLYLVGIGLIVTVPIGVGGAIYMSEYSKQGVLLSVIRFTIEILAGIPSIVYGMFGALFFVGYLKMGYSILAGGFTLAIITIPIIVRTTEEALKSVDNTYREAAISMGVNKIYVIKTILIPCALPGIITAIILSMGRMVGESAALLYTSGTAFEMSKNFFSHISESGASLTVQMYQFFSEKPQGMEENLPVAIGAVLMVIVFVLNLLTSGISMFFRKKEK